jgi:hypothetical protein
MNVLNRSSPRARNHLKSLCLLHAYNIVKCLILLDRGGNFGLKEELVYE